MQKLTTAMDDKMDWLNLGFNYVCLPWRFQTEWSNGKWADGELLSKAEIELGEAASTINYGQQCFEGLKAVAGPDGRILLFRPQDNAKRMAKSAERLMMPAPPIELFIHGVEECIHANRTYVPPHWTEGTLYIRPILLGVGNNLIPTPSERYVFRVFCSPVGPRFRDGLRGIRLLVTDFDRVAPNGTGAYKVGGNYAGAMMAILEAKQKGYDDVLYLDPQEHRYIEETATANVYGILPPRKPGEPLQFVSPLSKSVLPSITLNSLLVLAREELGLVCEQRQILIDDVEDFLEMGCTGTAAVITPVYAVGHMGRDIAIGCNPGAITQKLYGKLTGIQRGIFHDHYGWLWPIK